MIHEEALQGYGVSLTDIILQKIDAPFSSVTFALSMIVNNISIKENIQSAFSHCISHGNDYLFTITLAIIITKQNECSIEYP